MNLPTLDEAVERGARALLRLRGTSWEKEQAVENRFQWMGIRKHTLAEVREVLLAAEWEDLTAEVERLRENDRRAADEVGAHRSLTAQLQTHWQELEDERDSLRDLCDKLAEALNLTQDILNNVADELRLGANRHLRDDVQMAKQVGQAALSLHQEQRGT